jgi:hypothetical protein
MGSVLIRYFGKLLSVQPLGFFVDVELVKRHFAKIFCRLDFCGRLFWLCSMKAIATVLVQVPIVVGRLILESYSSCPTPATTTIMLDGKISFLDYNFHERVTHHTPAVDTINCIVTLCSEFIGVVCLTDKN